MNRLFLNNLQMQLPQPGRKTDKTFWERQLWNEGVCWVAGLDEAGRGAWAGPVVAAAVVFHPQTSIPAVDDSKKLSPEQRDVLFDVICREAASFGVGIISSVVIDKTNILQASLNAMEEAVNRLKIKPEFLLIDGNHGLKINLPQKALVKGDSLSLSIGAASILAKVTRDRLMVEMEKEFPLFKFSRHKGYGTRDHRDEIDRHGPILEHRMTFEPIKSLVNSLDPSLSGRFNA